MQVFVKRHTKFPYVVSSPFVGCAESPRNLIPFVVPIPVPQT